ncbi:MAG: hypothetical protein V2A34_12785 [Lentisphaerota bacterium]
MKILAVFFAIALMGAGSALSMTEGMDMKAGAAQDISGAIASETSTAKTPDLALEVRECAAVNPGLYAQDIVMPFTEENDGFDGTGIMKAQWNLKDNGTFTAEANLTIPEADIKNVLFYKLKGSWKQEENHLVQTDLLEQTYDFSKNKLSSWSVPEDTGNVQTSIVRNVTAKTFQEFDDDNQKWGTWTKP